KTYRPSRDQVAPGAIPAISSSGAATSGSSDRKRSVYRSSPSVSVDQARSRPSWLTENAPSAKYSYPSASPLPPRSSCSPGSATPGVTSGGTQPAGPDGSSPNSGATGTRQCRAYDSPSTVREKYHQPLDRTGTDVSVSLTRERISSWTPSSRPLRATVMASV